MIYKEIEVDRTSDPYWDKRANTYHNSWVGNTPEAAQKRRRVGDILIRHKVFRQGAVIADIASGEGTLLPFMKGSMGNTGYIIEIDHSQNMLDKAKENASKLFIPNQQIEFRRARGTETALPDNICDTVIVFNASPHFENKQLLIEESARILKPGGELFIAHSMSRQRLNQMRAHGKLDTSVDALPSEDEMRFLLDQSGFTVTEYIDNSTDTYYLVKAQLGKQNELESKPVTY